MKIATWNVNSIRVRLEQVLAWVQANEPDILALQETKMPDADFPAEAINEAGYDVAYCGQRTYNGVAILSRQSPGDVVTELPGIGNEEKRVLGATYGDIRVLNLYVPNGQEVGSDKYNYKLDWLEKLTAYVHQQLQQHPRLVLVGDFNVAPEERDCYDPEGWADHVLFSPPERAAFQRLLEAGLCDTFRLFDQPAEAYSWWDYRMAAFRRNRGLRIDHVLGSEALCRRCTHCYIDKEPRRQERPSDHTPVVAEFDV